MNATVRLLEAVVTSSVTVRAEVPGAHPSAQILGTERMGSGTIIDPGGIVLTVNYLVLGARTVEITLLDDTTVTAEVVAQDYHSGLAALRIPGSSHPWLHGRGNRALQLGEEVFILASAGAGNRRVSTGAISSLTAFDAHWEYHLEHAILTTAMNPGLGGGALVSSSGHLVGVVSLDLNEVGRFSLAIPVEYFFDHREELLTHGRRTSRPQRAWVGVFCYELQDHVVIAGVLPGAPSERAGLKAGDVILEVNGTPVAERRGLYHCLWAHRPGEVLTFAVFRQNASMEITLRAGDVEQFFA